MSMAIYTHIETVTAKGYLHIDGGATPGAAEVVMVFKVLAVTTR